MLTFGCFIVGHFNTDLKNFDRIVDSRPAPNPTLDTIEKAYIMWVLQSEQGNKTRAAETLGIDPSTLHRKLARYGGDA